MATYLKKKGKKKAYHLEFCFETSNLSSLHSQLLCWLLQARRTCSRTSSGLHLLSRTCLLLKPGSREREHKHVQKHLWGHIVKEKETMRLQVRQH